MATSISLGIGYMSGAIFKGDKKQAWAVLKREVERLRQMPTTLMVEATLDGSAPKWCCHRKCIHISKVCESYAVDWERGGPLTVHPDMTISISCSGEGGERMLKEVVALAFVRLVLRAIHQHGIHINVSAF